MFASAAALEVSADGIVTLDAQDDPRAVFIFQVGSALNLGARTTVRLINGAVACNVFWQVGSSATIGASSDFTGTVMASAAVTVGANTDVEGRVLAGTAVTLAKNTFTSKDCSVAPPDGGVDADGAAVGAGATADGATASGAGTGVSGSDPGGATGGTDGVDGSSAGGGAGGTDGLDGTGAIDGAGPGPVASDLPDTGAPGGTSPTFGLGLMMVLVGAVLVLVARQRRPQGRHRLSDL